MTRPASSLFVFPYLPMLYSFSDGRESVSVS
jgi:hypothetical protein